MLKPWRPSAAYSGWIWRTRWPTLIWPSVYSSCGGWMKLPRKYTPRSPYPPHTSALGTGGEHLPQKKDYAGARRAFERLLTLDPTDYTAHYNLGVLAAFDRNWRDAESHLRAALRTDPNSADPSMPSAAWLCNGKTWQARPMLFEKLFDSGRNSLGRITTSAWSFASSKKTAKQPASFRKRSTPILNSRRPEQLWNGWSAGPRNAVGLVRGHW